MNSEKPARPGPITAERWAELEPLLDGALDLPPERRRAYTDTVAAGDAALASELARLVAQLDRPDPLLDLPAAERFWALFDDDGGPASTEVRGRLQAALGDAYRIEREIGGGGMSRVFVASEAALGRQVVIKTLAPELGAGFSAERFARETRLAASLQQANIVPLLSAGSAGGLPYYTMPWVEGHSLRHRLAAEDELPIAEAVSILRDVARALTYAHAHGVVHRDIKPANVLLSGGTAMVTDFGIAKAFGAATAPGVEDTLTRAGTGLGTPAYMAPEQAAGDPTVDHRADLYAFGCVAYEMLTGRPPFEGDTHDVIAAHFRKTPRPIEALRPEVPPGLGALVARCLEKDPGRRPVSAEEVLSALDAVPGASPVPRPRLRGLAGSGPLARRRWYAVAGAIVIAALTPVAVHLARRARAAPVLPIGFAALPFRNLTGDSALDLRSRAMGEEILAAVGRLPGVRVTSRAAALGYGGGSVVDPRSVERALGARLLLTGTLREGGGRLVASAALHDSVDGRTLLAGTFSRDSSEFGALTTDVARAIADTLRARFGERFGQADRVGLGAGTTNGQALDLYLLGRALLERRGRGVPQSVTAFEHAIALDPHFARAYAWLAYALTAYPPFMGVPPRDVQDRTINAARRALELDSTLADPHAALGATYAYAGRWSASSAEFRRALALEPNNAAVHLGFGRLLLLQGRTDLGLAQLEDARSLERVSPSIFAWLAYGYSLAGEREAAHMEIDRALQLDSTSLLATNLGSLMALAQGRRDEARRLATAASPVGFMTNAPYVYARLGDTTAAFQLIRAMASNDPQPWFTDVERATVSLALGDTARALDALERSQRTIGPMWALFMPLLDPAYDPVRRSPRFAALLRQAGLDVGLLTAVSGGRP